MATSLFHTLVFPGILFLTLAGLGFEFLDRKMHARMQNRQGPPWFQPAADLIRLLAKETIVPEQVSPGFFRAMPFVALAAVVTPILYIPLWREQALFAFPGDSIVVLYLLTLPTLTFFLAGWYSTSLFSLIGAVRSLTQLFAYEIPLFMAVLGPALLADTWSLSGISSFYATHPTLLLLNVPGLGIAVVSLLGKLEKVPFDIPEAETEVVAGAFTEYSGKYLAVFRLAIDIEVVVAGSLLAAVFLPLGLGLPTALAFPLYLAKVAGIVALIAVLRTVFARLRLEQMVRFCWLYLAPAGCFQLFLNLIVKGSIEYG